VFEFTFDDLMRIRSWHFMTRQHHELVPRSVAIVQVCLLFLSDSFIVMVSSQNCFMLSKKFNLAVATSKSLNLRVQVIL